MTITFNEAPVANWRRTRVRGGAPTTDTERVIMFFLVMLFCGALVTGIVGSTMYIVKVNDNANIRTTRCEVIGAKVAGGLECQLQECENTHCPYQPKKCFEPQWNVLFTRVDSEGNKMASSDVKAWITDSTFINEDSAKSRVQEYGVGRSYKCSYISKDPANVHWGYDDPEPWMITMIVAWCVIGLFLCAMGFGWFFSKSTDV